MNTSSILAHSHRRFTHALVVCMGVGGAGRAQMLVEVRVPCLKCTEECVTTLECRLRLGGKQKRFLYTRTGGDPDGSRGPLRLPEGVEWVTTQVNP